MAVMGSGQANGLNIQYFLLLCSPRSYQEAKQGQIGQPWYTGSQVFTKCGGVGYHAGVMTVK